MKSKMLMWRTLNRVSYNTFKVDSLYYQKIHNNFIKNGPGYIQEFAGMFWLWLDDVI